MKTRTKTAKFPKVLSPAFREYADLLVQLDHLMRTGKDDSPESEDLRSRMDAPWYAMTEEEIQLADELSAQLYEISGEDRMRPLPDGKWGGEARLREAVHEKDWHYVLSCHPDIAAHFDSMGIHVLLGEAWQWADVPRAAAAFFRYAAVRGETTGWLTLV